ncbi:PSP1 domain-containing protein [Collinsella tanakaei]|uniref:PSP1 domain-containing protein n=1 Tax=Collinsella tanakaei TaxID=626935 RepID=UPI001F16B854|nr:regulatory iron-sulfur-containing complex subunit RicT [Collinsella tanakaei]MCF2621691.1 hypothetical protein [Collinsella tanakaei]
MPVVVSVKFPFASRDLWFDPQGLDIVKGDYAICSTERGTELGLVTADPHEVAESDLSAPLKPVLGIASDADLDRADELARKGEAAMADFRELVAKNGLDMKPVGVEFLFGGEKAVFYFAAEDRVDFRQLVKDLSSRFRTRVDMRQIGVRDETRLVGGYAHCGQELCCTRFGGQFEPVSIRMAKEQDLPLNSSKISGVCGRLMCCLRYEFEAYKDFKSRAPKKKTLIDTPLGRARIQEYDTPKEQLVLRLESGKVFRVSLSDMTCSDECIKRSQEQNCTCRPDTVTREVLDRIESPEMRMALMELDREMGVDVGDGLDRADRIVTSGPTPRRKKQRGESAAGEQGGKASGRTRGKGRSGEEAASEAPSSRRRRRRAEEATPADAAAASQGQPSRRRRRHLSPEERDEAFRAAAGREQERPQASEGKRRQQPSDEQAAGQGRQRRRHKQASDAPRGKSVKPDVPSVAEQVATGEVRVARRRPGDGGGAARANGNAAAPADAARADTTEGSEKKRRRRRRSRKPRSGGENPGAAPSSEA